MKQTYCSNGAGITVWSMVRPGGRYGSLVDVQPDDFGDPTEHRVEGSFDSSRAAMEAGLAWARANHPAD